MFNTNFAAQPYSGKDCRLLAGIEICPGLRTSTRKVGIGLSLSLLIDRSILPVEIQPAPPPLLLLATLATPEGILNNLSNYQIPVDELINFMTKICHNKINSKK